MSLEFNMNLHVVSNSVVQAQMSETQSISRQ